MTSTRDAIPTATTDGFDADAAARLLRGAHGDPFSVLGPHQGAEGWIVRAFLPGATRATLREARPETGPETGATTHPMTAHGTDGLFCAALPVRPGAYVFDAANEGGAWTAPDPYRYGPILGELDEHLISEGAHKALWTVLGAHARPHEGDAGTTFAVWAPDASRVSVVGDFNDWDGRRTPMRARGSTGVWEIFIPDLGPGARYKYEISGHGDGLPLTKSDPMARQAELRPSNCSIVPAPDSHVWTDGDWIEARGARQTVASPISVYEAHLGSWRRKPDGSWLTYRELAETLVPYVKDMGFTHLEVLPITEHPLDRSWGYQPIGLYAPTSRFGTPEDFRAFTEACHAAGIGLILDWVPAHFPIDAHGLARFDGAALYEHADPREGYHPDWNTAIYNLGRREVVNYLTANALYWLTEHHIDALRVDAVASMLYRDYSRKDGEWIPNKFGGNENLESIDFLRAMNTAAYAAMPGVMTVAEESTAWPGVSRPVYDGGLGFGFKWNMGWMHDTLEYMQIDPLYRNHHHGQMAFPIDYAFSENFVLPISHDEVVHGKGSLWTKMPGDGAAKLANLRAYYAFMWAQPGKKLLFMGQEFAQRGEWAESGQLEWGLLNDPGHEGLRLLVSDLNAMYRDLPALHERDASPDGFQWIDGAAADAGVYAWVRWGEDGAAPVMAVYNFSGAAHQGWRVGAPRAGRWRQILSTDAGRYGGADSFVGASQLAEPEAWHGQPQSVVLNLQALSAIWLIWEDA
ncbi:MAG: 1,4-alpha-glucan branching enzyme [Paracoccaceae bacterium]|jgi:1,4-alpha-glucan branching enzyme